MMRRTRVSTGAEALKLAADGTFDLVIASTHVADITAPSLAARIKAMGLALQKVPAANVTWAGDAILQHGALLEGWDGALQAGCLGLADDAGLRPAVVTLADVLGEAPAPAALSAALVAGFGAELGAHLVPSRLSAAERARAELLERERHAHERWLVHRDRAIPGE